MYATFRNHTSSPLELSPTDKVLWLKGWMVTTDSRVLEPYENAITRAIYVIDLASRKEKAANHRHREAIAIIDKAVRAAYAFQCERFDRGQQLLVQLGSVIQVISHRKLAGALMEELPAPTHHTRRDYTN